MRKALVQAPQTATTHRVSILHVMPSEAVSMLCNLLRRLTTSSGRGSRREQELHRSYDWLVEVVSTKQSIQDTTVVFIPSFLLCKVPGTAWYTTHINTLLWLCSWLRAALLASL
jgi:hypothetical protein